MQLCRIRKNFKSKKRLWAFLVLASLKSTEADTFLLQRSAEINSICFASLPLFQVITFWTQLGLCFFPPYVLSLGHRSCFLNRKISTDTMLCQNNHVTCLWCLGVCSCICVFRSNRSFGRSSKWWRKERRGTFMRIPLTRIFLSSGTWWVLVSCFFK